MRAPYYSTGSTSVCANGLRKRVGKGAWLGANSQLWGRAIRPGLHVAQTEPSIPRGKAMKRFISRYKNPLIEIEPDVAVQPRLAVRKGFQLGEEIYSVSTQTHLQAL